MQIYGGGYIAFLGFGALSAILGDEVITSAPPIPFWLNERLFLLIGLLCMPLPLLLIDLPLRQPAHPISAIAQYWLPKLLGLIYFCIPIRVGYLWARGIVRHVRIRRAARQSARQDNRPFVLLLRPFNVRTLFEHNATSGIFGSQIPDASVSILPVLERAISVTRPIVVLSDVDTPLRDRQWSSLEVKSSDKNWRRLFDLLAQTSQAIVVIPANGPGLLHEISSIVSGGMLDFCLFYQPPVFWFMPRAIQDRQQEINAHIVEYMKENWEAVSRRFELFGLKFPGFDPEGMFFSFDRDFILKTQRKIGSTEGRNAEGWNRIAALHSGAFNLIMQDWDRVSPPLCDVIGKIESIEKQR